MSKKVIKKNNRNFIPTAENTHYTKKGAKAKWSFWVVLALMVFWSVGAVLGIFATARSCNDSASVKTVSAAESTDSIPLRKTISYKGEKYFTFDIKGIGTSSEKFYYNLVVNCNYNFSIQNCIYVISRKGILPGSFVMRNITEGNFSEFNFNLHTSDNPFDNGFQLYTFSGSSFNCQYIANMIYDGVYNSIDLDLTFIITSQTPFNLQIPVLYENGFFDGISINSSTVSTKDSLGFFQGGTFKYYAGDNPGKVLDYDWKYLPEKYVQPYYEGVLNGFYGETVSYLYNGNYDTEPCFLMCDFGLNGKKLGGYSYFMVVRKWGDDFTSTGEFGSAVDFYFTDGSSVGFSTADDYFSYIDLASYRNKLVRAVVWSVARSDIMFFGLTSSLNVMSSYNSGYNAGFNDGYGNGYSVGLSDGKAIGRNQALASGNNYTFLGLLGAVVDAPITAISGLLNFDLLGFNMLNFFYALCTCALVIAVVRMIL